MLKGLCAAIALATIASSAFAQTVDNDRIIKYYRKKNNVPPSETVDDVDAIMCGDYDEQDPRDFYMMGSLQKKFGPRSK